MCAAFVLMLLKQSPLMRPPVLFAMGAVAVILLIYRFGNFREEKLVQRQAIPIRTSWPTGEAMATMERLALAGF